MELSSIHKFSSMLSSGSYQNIIVIHGAGVSLSAGIPDFRSPSTGLYSILTWMAIRRCRSPTFVFDYNQFLEDPRPFWWLFTRLWSGHSQLCPTSYHYFLTLLHRHHLLLRCYTQNVDNLEEMAGLPDSLIVRAHGVLDPCHCQDCRQEIPLSYCVREIARNNPNDKDYFNTEVPFCPKCEGAFVKPDIVFFGEDLPQQFYEKLREDLPKCDLLIIAGTSLTVFPFAGIENAVSEKVPRVVINRENVIDRKGLLGRMWGFVKKMIGVAEKVEERDCFIGGDLQEAIEAVISELGWQDFREFSGHD
jgi:NAD-dependent SIR2 family protein deacetylase